VNLARSPSPRQNAICPAAGMNPSDVQSETEPRYFDPEDVDMSEQQFAASLDATPAKPQFEIEEVVSDPAPAAPPAVLEPRLATPDVALTGKPIQIEEAPIIPEPGAALAEAADSEPDWRSLVSAKVNSYRAGKPHKDRYPSLKLQFDPPAPRMSRAVQAFAPVDGPRDVEESRLEKPSEPVFYVPPPQPDPPPRIVMEATARVIEFPRPVARGDELAEPVIDRPRIVEAPELLPPPPAMGGILIEEEHELVPERRPGFDVPLQSASLNRRVFAGMFDATLVLCAVALFGYVFIRMSGAVPPIRSTLETAAVLAGMFWAAFQYAFLVYCGRTPGLWAAKLHLARFDGQSAIRGLRRWRVLASVLSLASLGLGYAWTFLDEDQLSWHDRITKTHLAPN
jgi:uncharacterized RDD family membrane protein YckC